MDHTSRDTLMDMACVLGMENDRLLALRLLSHVRKQSDMAIAEAVMNAREDGATWSLIAKQLGSSTQWAHSRYNGLDMRRRLSA